MTFTMRAIHDIFVARPAALDTVQRTLQSCLPSAPFEGDQRGGSAALGHHAMLYVGTHGFSDDMVTFPAGHRAKLHSDFPVWISVQGLRTEFDQEATARRVWQVMANQQWPTILLHELGTMLAHAHCDDFVTTPLTPVHATSGSGSARPSAR